MTDTRMRELEREWKESGAVKDHATILVARVRSGHLEHVRLDLAARCGDKAATTAVVEIEPGAGQELVELLQQAGKEACVHAGLALGDALPAWTSRFPGDSRPLDLLKAVREWLLDPSAEEGVESSLRAAREAARNVTVRIAP